MNRSEDVAVHGTCKRDSRCFHDSIDPLESSREASQEPMSSCNLNPCWP